MTNFTVGGMSSNYQMGQSAHVGVGEITGCYGALAADNGIEIDNVSQGLCSGNTIENPFWQCYFYTNFATPLSGAGTMTFADNVATISSDKVPVGGNPFGYTIEPYSTVPIGTVTFTNNSCNITVTGDHRVIYVTPDVRLAALNVSGFTLTHSADPNNWPANYYIAANPGSGTVTLGATR